MLITRVLHVMSCCCYHKGTYFQANHNRFRLCPQKRRVVVATTKVRIFKQITTYRSQNELSLKLLLLPQRYVFSSKSQPILFYLLFFCVVVATTKVRIFKQITTHINLLCVDTTLLLLPQRYVFSSKSQLSINIRCNSAGFCCYHKGTYFQANHNGFDCQLVISFVVVATTKVSIFKQITTLDG